MPSLRLFIVGSHLTAVSHKALLKVLGLVLAELRATLSVETDFGNECTRVAIKDGYMQQ